MDQYGTGSNHFFPFSATLFACSTNNQKFPYFLQYFYFIIKYSLQSIAYEYSNRGR